MKPFRLSAILIAAAFSLVLAATSFASDDEARARELVTSLGCKGCHRLGDSGGSLGPALDGIGKRLSEEQIRHQLLAPKEINPSSFMPSYSHLDEEDLEALVDYLEDLR